MNSGSGIDIKPDTITIPAEMKNETKKIVASDYVEYEITIEIPIELIKKLRKPSLLSHLRMKNEDEILFYEYKYIKYFMELNAHFGRREIEMKFILNRMIKFSFEFYFEFTTEKYQELFPDE